MNLDTAAIAGKATAGAATSIAAYAFLTLTPMAWIAAILGAAASYYFEPEHAPGGALKLLFGITAMGFAAAMLAGAAPHLPFGIGPAAADMPVEIRAGLLGLLVRLLFEILKRWMRAKAPASGSATP